MAYAVAPSTGAILFPLREVSGLEAEVARILIRLRGVMLQWPSDQRHGCFRMSWLDQAPTRSVLEIALRDQLGQVDSIVAIRSLTVTGTTALAFVATIDIEVDGALPTVDFDSSDPYFTRGAPPKFTVLGGRLRQPRGI